MHQWGTPLAVLRAFYRQRMLIAFAECASCLYFETPIIVASEGSSRLIITLSSFPFLSFSDILLCNCAFYTQRSVDSFAESASCLYFETPIIIVASEGSSRLTTLSSFPSLSFYDILLLATGGNSKTWFVPLPPCDPSLGLCTFGLVLGPLSLSSLCWVLCFNQVYEGFINSSLSLSLSLSFFLSFTWQGTVPYEQ